MYSDVYELYSFVHHRSARLGLMWIDAMGGASFTFTQDPLQIFIMGLDTGDLY